MGKGQNTHLKRDLGFVVFLLNTHQLAVAAGPTAQIGITLISSRRDDIYKACVSVHVDAGEAVYCTFRKGPFH